MSKLSSLLARAFLLSSFLLTTAYLLYTSLPFFSDFASAPSFKFPISHHPPEILDSWLDNCIPHPLPHSFQPHLSSLALAVLYHADAKPHDGFTLALFYPQAGAIESESSLAIAVTHTGRVLFVPLRVFRTLLDLSDQTRALPNAVVSISTAVSDAPSRNLTYARSTWRVRSKTSFRVTERLITFPSSTSEHVDRLEEAKEIAVFGFSKELRWLEQEWNGYRMLPDPLYDLTGAVLEGSTSEIERERARTGQNDKVVLDKVMGLMDDWFLS